MIVIRQTLMVKLAQYASEMSLEIVADPIQQILVSCQVLLRTCTIIKFSTIVPTIVPMHFIDTNTI